MQSLRMSGSESPLWQTTIEKVFLSFFTLPGSYFKLQRRVAAAGGQRGHGREDQAVGQQRATGCVEQRVWGVPWKRWRDGRQRAEQVV